MKYTIDDILDVLSESTLDSIESNDIYTESISIYGTKTLSDLADQKKRYFNNHEKIQRLNTELAVKKEEIKRINEKYKNENYDSMTRMKYRRFRMDYHTKRNSILCKYRNELSNLENQYNINLNKNNIISDELKRRQIQFKLKKKYRSDKQVIVDRYRNIIKEFNLEYRYTIANMGLKWTYISVEELDV